MNNQASTTLSNPKLSALVVDDNKVNLLLVKNTLKKFGFAIIETADSGKMALSVLESNYFDIIFMDVQMPELDGFETTQRIRSLPDQKKCNVPVIALTGEASESEKQKARIAGMTDYIVKPYTQEEFFSVINHHLTSSTILTSNNQQRFLESDSIKLDSLNSLTEGDPGLKRQIIELFIQQVPESMQKLETFAHENDWNQVYLIAHKIKSTFAIFELENLKGSATLIEEYCREKNNLETISSLIQKMKQSAETAVGALKSELARL